LGHRAQTGLRHRFRGPDPSGRDAQNRTRIAQAAAKLIAEHGIPDWSLAKRKAARQLMLPDRAALPGDDEVEAALMEYHALFGGAKHAARLREQREEALRWMRRLSSFEPALVGGVAAGWATAHSDIRLDLTAGDTKAVELVLLNAGVAYRMMHATGADASDLYVDTPRGGVRLSVRTPEEARQRSRWDRHGNEEVRLDTGGLAALLADGPDAATGTPE
jgi:hypothetical protein